VKKTQLLIAVICLFTLSCAHSQDCVDGINKLPMYGNIKKCKQQIADDSTFVTDCDKLGTRIDVAKHMIMRGWQYFYNKNLDTAMMRFNQAWLLDSANSEIYWGFGDILGAQGQFKQSIPFFERSLKLKNDNARVWEDESVSYGNMFFQTKDVKFLNSTIYLLKRAIVLDPKNARLYGQLTASYSYFMQKDSARKYLNITDQLNPNAVNPQVRTMLENK
jgi:tetratricopeptide (TPR) repeat protein